MHDNNTALYHADLARWGEATAALLCTGRLGEVGPGGRGR